ncbi:MAG: hypothetical protein LBU60_02260 [Clostridiales bacterium]|jgi:hypothetical protein|nr:hypothetical protein [Clostridiales bacterium]
MKKTICKFRKKLAFYVLVFVFSLTPIMTVRYASPEYSTMSANLVSSTVLSQAEQYKREILGDKVDDLMTDDYSTVFDLVPKEVEFLYDESKDDRTQRSGGIVTNGDYFTSNLLQVAKPGDIVVQEAGFYGITVTH